jgi:uncharacterized protein YndB with AHSA1/START domain
MTQKKHDTTVTKDAASKKVVVVREFDGSVEEVWKAWTQPDLLDQWWAPKPWKANTKSMDFKEGGTWLYSMDGPEGEKHWSKVDYGSIEPGKKFTGTDAFCDENGKVSTEMGASHWNCTFSKSGDGTKVTVEITFDNEEDMNKLLEMGFEEGFTAAHGNLDELLAKK